MQTDQPRLSEAAGLAEKAPAGKVTAAEEAAVIGAAPGRLRVIKRNGAVVHYDSRQRQSRSRCRMSPASEARGNPQNADAIAIMPSSSSQLHPNR